MSHRRTSAANSVCSFYASFRPWFSWPPYSFTTVKPPPLCGLEAFQDSGGSPAPCSSILSPNLSLLGKNILMFFVCVYHCSDERGYCVPIPKNWRSNIVYHRTFIIFSSIDLVFWEILSRWWHLYCSYSFVALFIVFPFQSSPHFKQQCIYANGL